MLQRHTPQAVDQHAQRLTLHGSAGLFVRQAKLTGAHGQGRVVQQYAIGAADHCAAARAQALHIRTRGRAGNPFTFTAGHRRAAIQTHSQLDPHPGQTQLHTLDKARIQLTRLLFQQTASHLDTRIAQALQAITGNQGIGVLHSGYNAAHASRDQGIGAGRGLANMTTGFKGHVSGGAARLLTGLSQRVNFGMAFASLHVPALTHNLFTLHQHAADARIWFSGIESTGSQRQRAAHPLSISRIPLRHRYHPFPDATDARSLRGTDSDPGNGDTQRRSEYRPLRRAASARA